MTSCCWRCSSDRPLGAAAGCCGWCSVKYLGFIGTMAVAVAGPLGAGLLPESVLPYLELSPLALGLHAAWRLWRERHDQDHDGMPGRPDLTDHGHVHGGQQRGGGVLRFRHGYQSGLATAGTPATEADQMACSMSRPRARARMIASRRPAARPRGPRLSVKGDPGVCTRAW